MSRAIPYDLPPAFERAVAVYCCRSQRFFGLIGAHLQPECFATEPVRLAVDAAREVGRSVGHGPSHESVVLAALCSRRSKGSVNQEQIDAVVNLLEDADDERLPGEDEVVALLAPVLKKRRQGDAVRDALKTYGSDGDLGPAMKQIQEAERIGKVDSSVGTKLGGAAKVIASIRHLERLSTGIAELDMQLGMGPPRGTESIVIGKQKAGKSMMLNTVAANALLSGKRVLYATLELPVPWQLARLYAALTGFPVAGVLDGSMEEAERRVAALEIGNRFAIQEFPAGVATVEDIFAWIDHCCEDDGEEPDVVCIDYGDKVRAEASRETNSSKAIGIVFEKMRLRAHERRWWLWTASQAKNSAASKKKGDLVESSDAADSIDKVRVADLVVTLTKREEGIIYKTTYRYGEGDAIVGPLPPDFEHGRMVPELACEAARRYAGLPGATETVPF